MHKIRVFLTDDQPMFINGLKILLEKTSSEIEVVGTALSGVEMIDKIKLLTSARCADVALIDIKMPGMSGIEVTRALKKDFPGLKILMLTTFNDSVYLRDCFLAGADGFLLKDEDEKSVISAILNADYRYFLISRESFSEFLAKATFRNQSSEISRIQRLSAKQQEVFYLMIHGKDNNQIAEELCLSEKTVRNYVMNIYDLLEVTGRTRLLMWAQDNGLR